MKSQSIDNVSLRDYPLLSFLWDAARLEDFTQLLQQGFSVKAEIGASIRTVLCHRCGVSPEYLDTRINTIFLNGKAVDNVDSTIITADSALALSAAMPGFVGAAFRKGGFYSAMRKAITHDQSEETGYSACGLFTLKLYNLVAKELGPLFLSQGILVKSGDLKGFLEARSARFWSHCQRMVVRASVTEKTGLMEELDRTEDSVLLQVKVEPMG